LVAGNYSVTVTDATNCSASASVTIGQPSRILIGSNVSDATCGSNDGAINTIVSGGTPSYTYLWSSGQISADLSSLSSGAYELTVSDQQGCYADTTIVVSNIGGPTVTLNVTNNTCSGQNNGAISAVVSGGSQPYTYNWNSGASSASLTNLSSGTYVLTVTDANGCVAVRTATISQPAQLQVQAYHVDAACGINNGQAGVLAAGGVGPYGYLWSNNSTQQQLFNLSQGVYAVTVTDANGCQVNVNVVVDSLPVLTVASSIGAESCPGNNDGTITINVNSGTAPYAFEWNNGLTTQSGNSLAPGNYNITITDASGCVNVQNLIVPAATPLVLNGSVLSIVCGTKFGEATVGVSGGVAPYSYLWSTGDSVANLLVVFDGTYSVTVTDANGCQQATSVVVPRSSGPSLTSFATPDTLGNGNGTATVVPSNGNAPFTYEWSDGQTTPLASNLSAGSYVVTVTDADGCESTDTVSVDLFTSIAEGFSEQNHIIITVS